MIRRKATKDQTDQEQAGMEIPTLGDLMAASRSDALSLEAQRELFEERFGGYDDEVEVPVTRVVYTGPEAGGSAKNLVEESSLCVFSADVVRALATACVRAERAGDQGKVEVTFERWTVDQYRTHLQHYED